MAEENPLRRLVSELSDDDFAIISEAVVERRCREEVGFVIFAEAAPLYRPAPGCPECGHPASFKDGTGSSGLLPHVAEGSHITYDRKKAHGALIKVAKCTDEACKADVRDPVYLECMAMANSLCSWIKRYLWRFTGMDPANLQSYLNWYIYLFRVNQAKDKWPETEKVVRHLLMADARFRSSRV